MHGDELALQVARELRDHEAAGLQLAAQLVAVVLARGGQLEVKQAPIAAGNLHASIAERPGPTRDPGQRIEGRMIAGELREKNTGTFERLHWPSIRVGAGISNPATLDVTRL